MSITVLSERAIEEMGIDSYLDFAVRIPNLGTAFQSDGRFDANSPSLRGVFGSGDKSSSATGIYIDDVPVTAAPNPGCWTLNALRYCGTPGSLYGARSMGAPFASLPSNPTCRRPQGLTHRNLVSQRRRHKLCRRWQLQRSR